ncbi:MAG: hypothetical protein IJM83_03610 [Firmicutes bacterium]|nr:hypothetical protein [Bacillota bacterium]
MKRGWIILLVCLLLTGCSLMNLKEEKKEESSVPDESGSLSVPDETSSVSKPVVEDSKEEDLVIWTAEEMPVRIQYDRYWEYGDYTVIEDTETIEAIVQVIKELRVGAKTNIMVDDFTDFLTFYFPDETSIRLEFEEQNWVKDGERYHVDGLGPLREILNEVMEARFQQEDPQSQEPKEPSKHQIFVADAEHVIIFELNDSPAALSLFKQLPIEVEVEDYGDNEKIFYPPEKLDTTDGVEDGGEAGVLAYFEPWGDIVMYYGPFSEYPGLYILGEAIDFVDEISDLSGTLVIGVVQ